MKRSVFSLNRRKVLGSLLGMSLFGEPVLSCATISPALVRPRIIPKTDTLIVGYFGDSVAHGAYADPNSSSGFSYYDGAGTIKNQIIAQRCAAMVYSQGMDQLDGRRMVDGGIFGDHNQFSISSFATKLTDFPYDVAIVNVGINDARLDYPKIPSQLSQQQSVDNFTNTLADIYAVAANAGVVVVFETPNPIAASTGYAALLEAYRPAFQKYNLVVDQSWITSSDRSDDLHPSFAAYPEKVGRVSTVILSAMVRRYEMMKF